MSRVVSSAIFGTLTHLWVVSGGVCGGGGDVVVSYAGGVSRDDVGSGVGAVSGVSDGAGGVSGGAGGVSGGFSASVTSLVAVVLVVVTE